MWPSNALSSFTRWRDDGTAAYLGFGPAMPDLGYAEGMTDDELRAELVVALDGSDPAGALAACRRRGGAAPLPSPGVAGRHP